MKRKTIASIAMLVIMLFSLIGSAAAADEIVDDPITDPTTEVEQPGAKFFTHPVVKLLSAYFDQEEPDPSALPPSDPTDTDDEDSGLGPIGEKIAAYHEEGMGFGVLVKIFSMIEASEAACKAVDAPADCTPLTDEELVAMFKEEGMGALFKEYGKPAMLGVGHVKKELKAQEEETCLVNEDCEKVKEEKDKDKDKVKEPKDKTPKVKPEKPKKDK